MPAGSTGLARKGPVTEPAGDRAGRAPREPAYRRELEAEIERLRVFLQPR